MHSDEPCPCGNNQSYSTCCEPYHKGENWPETAEKLMRSRYSAYAKSETDYLFKTTHPNFRSPDLLTSLAKSCEATTWMGLEIHETKMGTPKDKIGKVSFTATFIENNEIYTLDEYSKFQKFGGKWHYCEAI